MFSSVFPEDLMASQVSSSGVNVQISGLTRDCEGCALGGEGASVRCWKGARLCSFINFHPMIMSLDILLQHIELYIYIYYVFVVKRMRLMLLCGVVSMCFVVS